MAVNRDTFLRLYQQIGPYWGRVGHWGRRFYGTWSMVLGDFVAEAARQASRHRLPWEESPLDSLTYLGADRALPQYPSESEKDYRNRIAPRDSGGSVPSVWDQHVQKVSPGGLRDQLLAAGYDVEIVEPFNDPAGSLSWSDYALRIHGFGELPCTPYDWNLPAWDSGWAWDTQIPAKEGREIRDVCRACAPARSRIVSLRCPDLGSISGLTLAHRWRVDSGVTTVSGSMISWDDSIAGATLEPSDPLEDYAVNPADTDMGDRGTILVKKGMVTSTQIGPATDWTAIVICYPDALTNPPIQDRRVFELTDSADSLGLALEHYDGGVVATESAAGTESTGAATMDGPVCYVVTADHGAGTVTTYRDGVALATVAYTPFTVGGVFGLAGGTTNRLIGRVAECALAWQTATAEQAGRAATYGQDYYGSVPYSGDLKDSPWKAS